LYISKINLKNIRCFSDETIELGGKHPSLLIAGNNGTGKSSILRSIAMGLCDEASAGGLLRELPGDFIRDGEDFATIEIWFTEEAGIKWIIVTELRLYKELNFERVNQKYYKNEIVDGEDVDWKSFPWEKLFIVGYGAGLRTDGTEDYDQYFSGDAVYSLFKYSQTLQNPELAWRRLGAEGNIDGRNIDDTISNILGEVLDLDENSKVVLRSNGIFIDKRGVEVELGATGDGYRSITTLMLDLLSWQFLMQHKSKFEFVDWEVFSLKDTGGIVIIDEVEKHLHPFLQRQIVEHLHNKFKNIQFIISTHSPLCVSGTADIGELDSPSYKIFCSYNKEDMSSGLDEQPVPRGLRYDQILVDYFKLPSTVNRKLQDKIDKLRVLLIKQHNSEPFDEGELKRLDEELKKEAPLLSEGIKDRISEQETRLIVEELRDKLIQDGILDDKD
jgi:predicted ATPase